MVFVIGLKILNNKIINFIYEVLLVVEISFWKFLLLGFSSGFIC